MLATFLYGIFIIISSVFLVAWYLYIKKVRRNRPDMPTEQLFLIAIGSLLVIIFIIWRVSYSIDSWQWKGFDFGFDHENAAKIHDFTLKVYKPLAASLEEVNTELQNMKILLADLDDLIEEHPRHTAMLNSAKKTWYDGSRKLKELQKIIKKEIRRAWIAHDTMNRQTVDIKFSRRAVTLDKDINIGLTKFRKLILDVHAMIRKDFIDSQKQLGKSKPQTDELNHNILDYSTTLTGKLLAFAKTIDPKIHQGMEQLLDEIAITEQRQEKNKQHLEENEDLSAPLIRVIDYWKEAELQNRYYFDQLLYALESELLGRKLGLKKNDYGVRSMNKTLKRKLPIILKKVQNRRDAIDNSY